MSRKDQGKKRSSKRIGFWHMWRDVLVASMNKGLFPIALAGLVFIVILIKMPAEDVSELVFRAFDALVSWSISGYVLSGIMLIGWMFHAKWQRRMITGEMKRIARERDRLQGESLGGDKLKSSEE